MALETMIKRYDLLLHFKERLVQKGYNFHQLSYLNAQIELLNDLIKEESYNVLNEILKKTNYRLLKRIEKGHEYLINVVNCPEMWYLFKIDDNKKEWLNNESLIFSTEKEILVFTKNRHGHRYINNKWQ